MARDCDICDVRSPSVEYDGGEQVCPYCRELKKSGVLTDPDAVKTTLTMSRMFHVLERRLKDFMLETMITKK